jgi:hypothetical protein
MRAELRVLLERIVEAHQRFERQVDERFNRLRLPAVVSDYQEFDDLLTRVFWQLYCPELGMKSNWAVRRDFVRGLAGNHLIREYGPSAFARAFEAARSGVNDGLRNVFRVLVDGVRDEFLGNAVKGMVNSYWRNATNEQRFQDARDYLAAYGHLLPGDLTEGSGAVILANFERVLHEHPRLILSVRRATRK